MNFTITGPLLLFITTICILVDNSWSFISFNKNQDNGISTDESQIKKVHVIFMNHLDVGYTNLVNEVLNSYFHEFFPRAVRNVEELKNCESCSETFVYTTHAWLVSLYLHCPPNMVLSGVKLRCPDEESKERFRSAVRSGNITWHAGPMNIQQELLDQSLYEFGLSISESLDKEFSIQRKYRTLSHRDIPGFTAAVIPTMVKNGVHFASVGVNMYSAPPAVPDPFVWKYADKEILVTYHPGGYPNNYGWSASSPGGLSRKDCTEVDGLSEALCFAFRGDNGGGPTSVQEIQGVHDLVKTEFPGADVQASTLDAFMEVLSPFKDQLPVVTAEIGDTWIQGIASDPRKSQEYRALRRIFAQCIKSGECNYEDSRFANASRFLVKHAEHTFGVSGVDDYVNYQNDLLEKQLQNEAPNHVRCINSWTEQRAFTNLTIESLGDHPIVEKIQEELQKTAATTKPDITAYARVDEPTTKTFECGNGVTISFANDGSISGLEYQNVKWADGNSHLSQFVYKTFNESDTDYVYDAYQWAGGEPGWRQKDMTEKAHPKSHTWEAEMVQLYQHSSSICDIYVNVRMVDQESTSYYGAPKDIWIHYTVREEPQTGVDIDYICLDKTRSRLPEGYFLAFTPSQQANHAWQLSKVGNLIDPLNVVLNGSQYQHGVDEDGVYYIDKDTSTGIQITSLDVPIVAVITPKHFTPYPAPLEPISESITGMAYNIYNNVWKTNFIFWYPYIEEDKNFHARFSIEFVTPGSPAANNLMEKCH